MWIGDSRDALDADLVGNGISVVLNCAADLNVERWNFVSGVEYVQIGLIDGPGNTMAEYHATTLKLCGIIKSGRGVLIHGHDAGAITTAVAIMALHALYRRGWDYWLNVIRELLETPDMSPHPEHRRAFNRINWRLVSAVMED